ncbi:MAG: hypothetical protein OEY78_11610 [Gammaproteobacteria bacterium]|nr:hypothetical protein [Gammaproteobacteria bacterium]
MDLNRHKIAVVITTINKPVVLESIARNCAKYNRLDTIEVIVVGDRKTPEDVSDYISFVSDTFGLMVEYMDINSQKEYLVDFPDLEKIIPYDSDNRRNIGHLIAYERKADVIVALDDDNFPLDESDFLAPFDALGSVIDQKMIKVDHGWYNICNELESEFNHEFYPRGFPYNMRGKASSLKNIAGDGTQRLMVKAGLWLGDPDIDAATRLVHPIDVRKFSGNQMYLYPGTRCPFNTQNTGFHRELMPSMYYVCMGKIIGGQKIDRYGDIWLSYFLQKVMSAMRDVVGFGFPLVNHSRNQHDLLEDLGQEYPGMLLTNKLVEFLNNIELDGQCYVTYTRCLAEEMLRSVQNDGLFTESEKKYIDEVANNILIWLDAVIRVTNR